MKWKRFLLPVFYRQGISPGKPLIDGDYIEKSIEKSPAPIVLILVLIWIVAAVLLTLSDRRQRDLTVWADGQKAPFSVWARTGFSYEDPTATERLREQAKANEPRVYRINSRRQLHLERNLANFFSALQLRENSEAEKRVFIPGDSAGSKMAAGLIDFRKILGAVKKNGDKLDAVLRPMIRHGIAGSKLELPPAPKEIKVISANKRNYLLRPPTPKECALKLSETIGLSGNTAREFIRCMENFFDAGTLDLDVKASELAAETAASAVKPVIKNKYRDDLLVERHQNITGEVVNMLNAEREALPRGFGFAIFSYRLGVCFILMLVSLFFLYRTYPKIFTSTRKFAIGGGAIVIALLANYGALGLFLYLFRSGTVPDYDLMLFMIPIPMGAALVSVLLGSRTAMFSGFLISSLTALMILPDRSFELALRWFAISALMALVVRDVSNYRSFFVRVFLGGCVLIALINSDILLSYHSVKVLKIAFVTIAANSFGGAVAALLLIFAFELIFNTDTNMSLMVLSDYNHPLLEKLKREAPGTMYHSMTVATLAEDAAKAIGANPLRAKAGALFHDIGKLTMPQYFVENNVDSPKDHLALPPQRSCSIIRGHVKEGLVFAREYRLCSFIRDAICTHHGDDLISFFYRRALEEHAQGHDAAPVLESQFRYDGEPPHEKELTIISLADACEAASRSLNKPSPAKLESLVNEIFLGRLRGGQLRNSELTLEELDKVRECFITDLISFNHGRIAYQKESNDDTTALPVEEPPASGSEKK